MTSNLQPPTTNRLLICPLCGERVSVPDDGSVYRIGQCDGQVIANNPGGNPRGTNQRRTDVTVSISAERDCVAISERP